jgi:uncharacterized protein YcfL
MKFAIRSLLVNATLVVALMGCASSTDNLLKPTETVAVEGDSPTKMIAPDNGQITVYDVDDDRTIWTGAISKGQTLVLDPANKQIKLDGLACNREPLESGHTLKVSFDKTH